MTLLTKTDIKPETIEIAIDGVLKFAAQNPKTQSKLFDDFPVFLQVNSIKIPKTKGGAKQLFRVSMPNSILPEDPDICLIVPDVKGIPNKEHERHVEHYENLLQSKKVTGIKKIMTFHEFRTEYDTFELKNRLVDLYDMFLVDGKISGKVVHNCGKIFYKKRKVPLAVKLHLKDLKAHLEQSLKKVSFHISMDGTSHNIQIGNNSMPVKNMVENVQSAVEFIKEKFPGGMENIRSLNAFAYRCPSIPIYVSFVNPNDVKVPTISQSRPKAYKSFQGELTTQYNADVLVKPSGKVIVRRKKAGGPIQQTEDENITDADIIMENKKVDNEQKDDKTTNKLAKKRKADSENNNSKPKKAKTILPKSKSPQTKVKLEATEKKENKTSLRTKKQGKKQNSVKQVKSKFVPLKKKGKK